MLPILIIILVFLAVGGSPVVYPHSYGWGPSGVVGVILILLVIFLLLGRL